MPTDLIERFEASERRRLDLLGTILALTDAQRDWRAYPGAWSVREIVEHLVLSDETIGQGARHDSFGSEPSPLRLIPGAWRLALVVAALRRGVVLPLPSSDVEPRGEASFADLRVRWDASRETMLRTLETLRGDERRYAHPILGDLDARQMLRLEEAHMAYHRRQMAAVQADPRFPR